MTFRATIQQAGKTATGIVVPPDVIAAFERHTAAARAFDSLSYSARQRHVLPIEAAKTPETRERRINKTRRRELAASRPRSGRAPRRRSRTRRG